VNFTFLPVCRRVVAHWRAIVLLLILARVAFLVAHFDEFVRFEFILLALLLIFIASQIFWIRRLIDVGERLIPGRLRRVWLMIVTMVVYLFVLLYSYPEWGLGHVIRAADYRPQNVLIHAVFWWWFVGSMSAFLLVVVFGAVDRVARAAGWAYQKARTAGHRQSAAPDAEPALLSPGRRHFLERTAVLVSATPFLATGYGLLYERQDVEIVHQRIRLARLPKAFEGFRIAQLSDIHLGPFTTADYIRRCVAITNGLQPDLIALTGDYVCWDPDAQSEVVRVLAGLRAPHGVFGCLGNHEADVGIEDSITRLFAAQGIRMLRQESTPIRLGDDTLNLIGIDDGGGVAPEAQQKVEGDRRLQQLKTLIMPDTVNILLVHYPQCFDQIIICSLFLMTSVCA
jgi:Calcineurin-like phosphoesterase